MKQVYTRECGIFKLTYMTNHNILIEYHLSMGHVLGKLNCPHRFWAMGRTLSSKLCHISLHIMALHIHVMANFMMITPMSQIPHGKFYVGHLCSPYMHPYVGSTKWYGIRDNVLPCLPFLHMAMAASRSISSSPLGRTGTTHLGLLIISSSLANSASGNSCISFNEPTEPSMSCSCSAPSPPPDSSCCTGTGLRTSSCGTGVASSRVTMLVLGVGAVAGGVVSGGVGAEDCGEGVVDDVGGAVGGAVGGGSCGESPPAAGLPRMAIVMVMSLGYFKY